MKNKILIGVSVLASLAAGYYIYIRIRDRNKTIIPVVGGVIVLEDYPPSVTNQLVDDSQNDDLEYLPDDLIYEPLDEGEMIEPMWGSDDTIPNYGSEDTIP
jgi:hypothetical protein